MATMAEWSKAQEEEARQYLLQRLDDEASMKDDVDNLLRHYIPLLVGLLLLGASQQEIDALLDDLVAELIDDCDTLAVDEHEDERDAILLFIHGDMGGKTLDDRVRERVNTLLDEVATVVLIGMLLGHNEKTIVSSLLDNMANPWKNPLIIAYKEMVARGEIAPNPDIDPEERHYGQGIPISSLTGLTDVTVYGVSAGWCLYDYESHKDISKGYFVLRGSSYPCPECDSHVGYHDISDVGGLPLYHNHCKCYVVWVNK